MLAEQLDSRRVTAGLVFDSITISRTEFRSRADIITTHAGEAVFGDSTAGVGANDWAYLHKAIEAGRAKPVPTNNPHWTRGWVPVSIDVPTSPIEDAARLGEATRKRLVQRETRQGSVNRSVTGTRPALGESLARESAFDAATDQSTRYEMRLGASLTQLAA